MNYLVIACINHSVLDSNVQMSQYYLCHILALDCLNLKEKKKLTDYISEITDNVQLFMKNWCAFPLRWISASNLSFYNFFVRNDDIESGALMCIRRIENLLSKYIPTFVLVQTLLKNAQDVDDFLLMIISTHGFFNVEFNLDQKLDDNEERIILLNIFHFVLCLIFDTLCSEKNYFQIRRLCIISNLMKGDLTKNKISTLWYENPFSDDKFFDDLLCYASKNKDQK